MSHSIKYCIQDKETQRFFNKDTGDWVIDKERATAFPWRPTVTYREEVIEVEVVDPPNEE